MYIVLAFSVLAQIHSKTGQNKFSPCVFRVRLNCLATVHGPSLFSAHVCLRISFTNLQKKMLRISFQLRNFFFVQQKAFTDLRWYRRTVRQELALDTGQKLTISISLPNKNLTSTNKDSVVYTDPALSHGGFSSLKEERWQSI